MEIHADVYNKNGEKIKSATLDPKIFGVAVNPALVAQAVKVFLANQRRGTANTKGRGEISGGGKKPWRQKGTGRARQGSTRAPHWIKGGIAHGPEPRDWSLSLNKKMKRLALFSTLSSKALENNIVILENPELTEIKTKPLATVFGKVMPNTKLLFVLPQKDNTLYLSTRNIEYVTPVIAKDLNAYIVLNHQKIILLEESLEVLKAVFIKEEPTVKAKKAKVIPEKKTAKKKKSKES